MSGGTRVAAAKLKRGDATCPRDKVVMKEFEAGEAMIEVCHKCNGQFFDTGEMYKAFGIQADPSIWDREQTGGAVKDSELHCPICHTHMLAQDVAYQGEKVEIDRCGHCGGIWLDKGEIDQLVKIGEKLQPLLDEEKKKAQDDLAKLDANIDFSAGFLARFVRMFKGKEKPAAAPKA
jgi:Zn-finger nucleic acid-binding protein